MLATRARHDTRDGRELVQAEEPHKQKEGLQRVLRFGHTAKVGGGVVPRPAQPATCSRNKNVYELRAGHVWRPGRSSSQRLADGQCRQQQRVPGVCGGGGSGAFSRRGPTAQGMEHLRMPQKQTRPCEEEAGGVAAADEVWWGRMGCGGGGASLRRPLGPSHPEAPFLGRPLADEAARLCIQ